MEPLMLEAGTTLVAAMATDAWRQVRAALVSLWRRSRPEQAEDVEDDLSGLHERAAEARRAGDVAAERELAVSWEERLRRLLREDPSSARELKRILDEEIGPVARSAERPRITSTTMRATTHDQSRAFQAGRDQNITE